MAKDHEKKSGPESAGASAPVPPVETSEVQPVLHHRPKLTAEMVGLLVEVIAVHNGRLWTQLGADTLSALKASLED